MTDRKTQWIRPQLIVLAKGTPEESVLTVCKQIQPQFTGPIGSGQNGCQDPASPSKCGACQARPGGLS